MTAHAREPTTAGSRVRVLRSLLGITQEQMAQELGVSFATVNRWETGRRVPSASSQGRLDALAASAPAPTSAERDRHSQPAVLLVPATSFIGRQMELGELEELLKVSRLLTLVGPGGSGKTRLAMELTRRTTKSADPVTVVALDVVADPKLVATAISAALGLRDAAGVSPEVQINSQLAAVPRLLVLDNCEHVVEAVSSLVAAALMAAPDLRVLATSRTVLNVSGEQVWVIPSLELPGPGSTPADVDRCDAGRLFVSRAQSRRPGFVLDQDSAAAVASICRLLDGLPLALELAAAWSAMLSAPELARRLEESLSLLDVSAGRVGRQRTLRATVEWS